MCPIKDIELNDLFVYKFSINQQNVVPNNSIHSRKPEEKQGTGPTMNFRISRIFGILPEDRISTLSLSFSIS